MQQLRYIKFLTKKSYRIYAHLPLQCKLYVNYLHKAVLPGLWRKTFLLHILIRCIQTSKGALFLDFLTFWIAILIIEEKKSKFKLKTNKGLKLYRIKRSFRRSGYLPILSLERLFKFSTATAGICYCSKCHWQKSTSVTSLPTIHVTLLQYKKT